MTKKLFFLLLIITSSLLFSACTKPQETTENITEQTSVIETIQEDKEIKKETLINKNYESYETNAPTIDPNLVGVEGYTSTGTAVAKYNETDGYQLFATIKDLPDPEGTDFYEGWVVRESPLSVISTGKLNKVDGQYQNEYFNQEDLTDHLQYVLTIEPDDGDLAPAGHVVEGPIHFIK